MDHFFTALYWATTLYAVALLAVRAACLMVGIRLEATLLAAPAACWLVAVVLSRC